MSSDAHSGHTVLTLYFTYPITWASQELPEAIRKQIATLPLGCASQVLGCTANIANKPCQSLWLSIPATPVSDYSIGWLSLFFVRPLLWLSLLPGKVLVLSWVLGPEWHLFRKVSINNPCGKPYLYALLSS